MKKALVSIIMVIAIAAPRVSYAAENPYASLTYAQKQVLIAQLTALLHKILYEIAQIESKNAILAPMSDEQIEPAPDPVAPQVEPEEVSPETPPSQGYSGYSGPAGYSSLAI